MNDNIFLIDSNSFMEPSNNYYSFDLVPKFWDELEKHMQAGSILILDKVYDEVTNGNDELQEWMSNLNDVDIISHKNPLILSNYSKVLMYLQNNKCYRPSALTEWSNPNVADPWLIATAMSYGYKIVSFEKPNNGLNIGNPSKKAKIPNVAEHFGVEVFSLYQMMRYLNFKL